MWVHTADDRPLPGKATQLHRFPDRLQYNGTRNWLPGTDFELMFQYLNSEYLNDDIDLLVVNTRP